MAATAVPRSACRVPAAASSAAPKAEVGAAGTSRGRPRTVARIRFHTWLRLAPPAEAMAPVGTAPNWASRPFRRGGDPRPSSSRRNIQRGEAWGKALLALVGNILAGAVIRELSSGRLSSLTGEFHFASTSTGRTRPPRAGPSNSAGAAERAGLGFESLTRRQRTQGAIPLVPGSGGQRSSRQAVGVDGLNSAASGCPPSVQATEAIRTRQQRSFNLLQAHYQNLKCVGLSALARKFGDVFRQPSGGRGDRPPRDGSGGGRDRHG